MAVDMYKHMGKNVIKILHNNILFAAGSKGCNRVRIGHPRLMILVPIESTYTTS